MPHQDKIDLDYLAMKQEQCNYYFYMFYLNVILYVLYSEKDILKCIREERDKEKKKRKAEQVWIVFLFSLVKQVFPHLDFMGWYSLGITPNESDLKIHEQVNK